MGFSRKSLFKNRTNRLSTRKLVIASILCSISVVLTRYMSVMIMENTVRLGFGNIPIILSGMLLGPFAGGLTGIASDIIGVMLNPMGSFHPGFTLSGALTGIIPGIIAGFGRKNKLSLTKNIASHISVYLLISLLLNTYWLSQLMGRAFMVLLPNRVIGGGITTLASIIVILLLSKFLKHMEGL